MNRKVQDLQVSLNMPFRAQRTDSFKFPATLLPQTGKGKWGLHAVQTARGVVESFGRNS